MQKVVFIFTVVSISTFVFKVIQNAGPELRVSRYYLGNIIFIQSLKNNAWWRGEGEEGYEEDLTKKYYFSANVISKKSLISFKIGRDFENLWIKSINPYIRRYNEKWINIKYQVYIFMWFSMLR